MITTETTQYGPVEIHTYINETGDVCMSVHAAHNRQPDWGDPGNPVPPLMVNGIPCYGTINLSAIVGSDTSHPDNWKLLSYYLKRNDKHSWDGNDTTDNQVQKLLRMAREEASKLFENPAVLPLLRIEAKEAQIEEEQKRFDKLRIELQQAEARLSGYKKALAELRKLGGYEKPLSRVREDPKAKDYEGGKSCPLV